MSKSKSGTGRGSKGPQRVANLPSKTGKPSGKGRGNAPAKK